MFDFIFYGGEIELDKPNRGPVLEEEGANMVGRGAMVVFPLLDGEPQQLDLDGVGVWPDNLFFSKAGDSSLLDIFVYSCP